MTKHDSCRATNLAGKQLFGGGDRRDATSCTRRTAARLATLWLATAAAVFCQSVIVTDVNGNAIAANSTILLPKDDSGLTLIFNVSCPANIAVVVYVAFQYTDQSGYPVANYWDYNFTNGPHWVTYLATGGGAYISWQGPCTAGNLSFTVAGQNPDPSAVDALLVGLNDPWFISSLLAHEDYNPDFPYIYRYRQYADSGWPNGQNTVGMPLWGTPDGIGIGQYEVRMHAAQNPYVAWDYFSWTQNLIDSSGVLWSLQNDAYQYWYNQLAASGYTPPPWTAAGGYCPLFGYPPGDGFADYADTIWMTRYNQGPNAIPFIEWTQGPGQNAPQWNFPNLRYVDQVCQTPPI